MVQIYDSQTRQKREFVPLDPGGHKVGMYYCGPTVYDSVHLGHARAAIVPDLVRRYLEYRGFVVRYVANMTDVDDKIILRAIREQRDWREITSVYTYEWHRVMAALGCRPADAYPRATDHIPEMIDLVQQLIDRGNAYPASNGDVYFDTRSFEGYLALSGRRLEDQETGRSGRLSDAEVERKKHPADFILWKLLANDPESMRAHPDRVPGWDSPWGRGRPGWHLECSAISAKYLGMPFDIHGGGRDLLFPHHENERAQNDCAYCDALGGESSVRYWIHNGFITVAAETEAEKADEYTVDGQSKMSKSLGNVKWLKDMIWPDGPYDPMAVRMLMLQCHYRSPLQFSVGLFENSMARVDRIYSARERLQGDLDLEADASDGGSIADAVREAATTAVTEFEAAMDDDFNTPRALAAIDGLINGTRGVESEPDRRHAIRTLDTLGHTLGLRTERPAAALSSGGDDEAEAGLLDLLGTLRQEARRAKDFATADRIRDQLGTLGFEIRDSAGGGSEIVRKS
ncbi:MAG: cysteine--tRNA ligase [Acidobacteriota bacterium]